MKCNDLQQIVLSAGLKYEKRGDVILERAQVASFECLNNMMDNAPYAGITSRKGRKTIFCLIYELLNVIILFSAWPVHLDFGKCNLKLFYIGF
ncbi:hypothetical protein TNIN_463081 [Trichonephila inaurata madagascariensis]|uniref:Uncharacterized protein n=1 Tax=Trichonephila inaurata madagascariensis TaxID=2747483 RepID=A0A8X6Y5R9_9ARAC|nr:hypothetical protein TNIN_463081 [Trichonephila inaurata madagascariensis]